MASVDVHFQNLYWLKKDDDDEIEEDSFVAHIDANIFDSVTDAEKADEEYKKVHDVITFEYDNSLEPTKLSEVRESSLNDIVDITDGYNMCEL